MTRSWVGIVGALVLLAPFRARGADVLTQHNDNARSGANTAETVLTTKNVAPDKFGKLWTLFADGQVVAQPLYVSKLAIGDATVNAVIVATMHNTVYAYDADQEKAGPNGQTTPLWARWLGEPRPGDKHAIDMWSTNDPEWGVVSTPVIDAAKTTLWLTSWHKEGNSYKLHALDLKTGQDKVPPVQIGGAPVAASKPCEYPEDFNPCTEKQRAGLLLQDNVVYVGFGGTDNQPPRGGLQPGGHYAHGSLFAFDATNLHQLAHWVTTPAGINGGIWGSGQGPAADKDGNVYVVTGNGTFTANNNGKDYGNSFVKVKLENGALAVKSSFTPCNQQWLDGLDLDLGSAGAMLVPNTNLLLGGGKEGVLYLLSRNALGGYAAGAGGPGCANPNVVQAFMATGLHDHGAGVMYGHIHSAPVYWKGPGGARVYVWGENDRLKAFAFSGTRFTNTANPVKSVYQPPMGMPGGMLSVSSNGAKAQTGIVWAAVPLNGDANAFRGVQGVLVAMDAQDISRQLWTSELGGPRDRLGLFAKFVPPTIAGGKVFVATYGDAEALQRYGGDAHPPRFPAKYYVAVYGLLEAHQHPAGTIVNQEEDDVAVLKAVAVTPLSLDPRTCAPADAGNIDCTAALAQKFGAPAFHTLIVPANYNFAGCSAMTVTTASKQPALATSTGIGWYASDATAADQAMTSGRFVPTAELKQVGAGTLKAGGPALLHQFVGVANCTVGAGSYDKVFKPFMQFENSPDGKVFRNWARAQNFRITRAAPTIDNTAQVLQ